MLLKQVTFYFVDHDEVPDDEVEALLQNCCFPNDCISPRQISVSEVDIGDWYDGHRCNFNDYDVSQEFKQGYWIYHTENFAPEMRCSCCLHNFPVIAGEKILHWPDKFCSNCGAKMIPRNNQMDL